MAFPGSPRRLFRPGTPVHCSRTFLPVRAVPHRALRPRRLPALPASHHPAPSRPAPRRPAPRAPPAPSARAARIAPSRTVPPCTVRPPHHPAPRAKSPGSVRSRGGVLWGGSAGSRADELAVAHDDGGRLCARGAAIRVEVVQAVVVRIAHDEAVADGPGHRGVGPVGHTAGIGEGADRRGVPGEFRRVLDRVPVQERDQLLARDGGVGRERSRARAGSDVVAVRPGDGVVVPRAGGDVGERQVVVAVVGLMPERL